MENNRMTNELLDAAARERGAGESDLWPRVEGSLRQSGPRQSAAQSEWMPLPSGAAKRARRREFNFGMAGGMALMLALFGTVALVLGLAQRNVGAPEIATIGTPIPSVQDRGTQDTITPRAPMPPWRNEATDFLVSLTRPIGMSKVNGPYTVTLDKGYTDSHAIVLVYTIEVARGVVAPDNFDSRLGRRGVELRTEEGVHYSPLTDSVASEKFVATGDLESGVYSYAVAFDTSTFGPITDTLHLSFAPVIDSFHNSPGLLPLISHAEPVPPRGISDSSATDQRMGKVSLATFDFSLPFNREGARVVEVNETVTRNGVSITLDRVRVAPSGASLDLRYETVLEDDPTLARFDLQPHRFALAAGTLSFDASRFRLAREKTTTTGSSGPHTYNLYGPLAEQTGAWRLDIGGMWDFREFGVAGKPDEAQRRDRQEAYILGPWEFTFTVPPAER